MRKKIVGKETPETSPQAGELNIAAIATVLVSSEAEEFPIENVFDNQRGPGGSRWVAGEPGEQTITLVFDTPQRIHQVSLEIEEQEVGRTQELQVSASHDNEQAYHELIRQEFNFSPPGTSFEREKWTLNVDQVTHLRLRILPDKGGKPCRATLTSLILR